MDSSMNFDPPPMSRPDSRTKRARSITPPSESDVALFPRRALSRTPSPTKKVRGGKGIEVWRRECLTAPSPPTSPFGPGLPTSLFGTESCPLSSPQTSPVTGLDPPDLLFRPGCSNLAPPSSEPSQTSILKPQDLNDSLSRIRLDAEWREPEIQRGDKRAEFLEKFRDPSRPEPPPVRWEMAGYPPYFFIPTLQSDPTTVATILRLPKDQPLPPMIPASAHGWRGMRVGRFRGIVNRGWTEDDNKKGNGLKILRREDGIVHRVDGYVVKRTPAEMGVIQWPSHTNSREFNVTIWPEGKGEGKKKAWVRVEGMELEVKSAQRVRDVEEAKALRDAEAGDIEGKGKEARKGKGNERNELESGVVGGLSITSQRLRRLQVGEACRLDH